MKQIEIDQWSFTWLVPKLPQWDEAVVWCDKWLPFFMGRCCAHNFTLTGFCNWKKEIKNWREAHYFYSFILSCNRKIIRQISTRGRGVWSFITHWLIFARFFGYFMLRGCKLQFESSFIVRLFITQVNSGQFNLFLQLGLISSIFSYYDFPSLHHP